MTKSWLQIDQDTDLGRLPAGDTPGWKGDKDSARAEAQVLRERLETLQRRLFAENRRSLLLILQAVDAGGKDGAVRKVFAGLNPRGVRAVAFEAPTDIERAHDFLWRVHREVPPAGTIGVFVRSHYEDVVTARVRGTVPEPVWRARYAHIRHFESLLHDAGTRIVKAFLHIDRDEQKERLLARLQEPEKLWKFDPDDLDDRARWDDFMRAYRDAIVHTHRPHAPWYVIPANKKWFRDLALLRLLVETLQDMDPQYPPAAFDPDAVTVD